MNHCTFGGIDIFSKEKVPNLFKNVRFEKCNLRSSAHSCELYEACQFVDCRLDGVNFLGARFGGSTFSGVLTSVDFRSQDPGCPEMPPNDFRGCSFHDAKLVYCQFLRINLDPKMFALNKDWLWLPNGPEIYQRWRDLLGRKSLFLDHEISLAGSPTYINTKELLSASFTPKEVDLLRQIVEGNA